MRKWLKQSAFTLWLFAAVLLAVLFPGPASTGGVLHPEITTKLGVRLIFFLLGLSLPLSELTSGYKPVRLHVFVLVWNYLGFPLVASVLLWPLSWWLPAEFKLGFWLLAIMPTTIASAVTFTTIAGGRASSAIVSTVLSNVLAVFVVPVIAVIYLSIETAATVPLTPLLFNIASLILLPLVIGQCVHALFPLQSRAVGRQAKRVSSAIILFIVHAAFANSISSGDLDGLSLPDFLSVLSGVVLLLLATSFLVWSSSRLLRCSRAERIAAFYCASQKSLATGLPLAAAILAAASDVVDPATMLIPLILFHPLQLMLAGVLSKRIAQ